jgi:hypothetical protein
MSRPSHPSWSDRPNNISWSVQIMKLLIMQSSPFSRHFLHLNVPLFSSAPCSQTPTIYVTESILSQMDPVHILTHFSSKSILILSCHLDLSPILIRTSETSSISFTVAHNRLSEKERGTQRKEQKQSESRNKEFDRLHRTESLRS